MVKLKTQTMENRVENKVRMKEEWPRFETKTEICDIKCSYLHESKDSAMHLPFINCCGENVQSSVSVCKRNSDQGIINVNLLKMSDIHDYYASVVICPVPKTQTAKDKDLYYHHTIDRPEYGVVKYWPDVPFTHLYLSNPANGFANELGDYQLSIQFTVSLDAPIEPESRYEIK